MALTIDKNTRPDNAANPFRPDCKKCFGLCCAALYFSAQDGFPADKAAGTPCPHLDHNFRCDIHKELGTLGFKGCIAFECFGAGQQVSQVVFKGQDWRTSPSSAEQMFKVFLILQQVYEMCRYLTEALSFKLEPPVRKETEELLSAAEQFTRLGPQDIIESGYSEQFSEISDLLKKISRLVRREKARALGIDFKAASAAKKDYFGKDLRKKDLRCADLRRACLIAANLEGINLYGADLIGADLRDADLRGADLSESLFLTQFQINTAKGNAETKLPSALSRPASWD